MGLKELFKRRPRERSILEKANCSVGKDGKILQNGTVIDSGDIGDILQRAVYRVDENGAIVSNQKA